MKKKIAALCAAAAMLCSCGNEIQPIDFADMPSREELSLSVNRELAVTEVGTEHRSDSSSDSSSFGISAVTELGDSSSSADPAVSGKKKNKKEKAVTDLDSSSSADGASGDRSGEIILNYNDTPEVYSKVKMRDFIERTNAELLQPDALVDTRSLGKHEASIPLKYGGETYSATVRYTVHDTRAPIVLGTGDGASVPMGSYFDLDNYISYADNYDRSPKLSYEGVVDTNTAGAYEITATLTDSSDNSYSWSLTVYVGIDPPVYDSMTGDGMSFEEFRSAYAGENRAFGIDVSQWQGSIDFNAVKEAGCEFVIMRIACGDIEGMTLDNYYMSNIDNATAAGIPVGIYFYSEDNNPDDVRDHARWIAGLLAGRKLDFPIAFDWEDFEHFQSYGMSIDDLNELFEAFADELSLYGQETMLYSSKNFLENFWDNAYHRPVWLAHYVDQTDYAGEYILWQRCYG
ncbi:MAG: hypothetical protein K6B74_12100, partial [Ruminococcus sp.]|nr:hypothetical protein [Ruminococcus sp.]